MIMHGFSSAANCTNRFLAFNFVCIGLTLLIFKELVFEFCSAFFNSRCITNIFYGFLSKEAQIAAFAAVRVFSCLN